MRYTTIAFGVSMILLVPGAALAGDCVALVTMPSSGATGSDAAKNMIENSENADLVAAYKKTNSIDTYCKILHGFHDHGDPCPGYKSNYHITVRILIPKKVAGTQSDMGQTFHVFPMVDGGKYCTTANVRYEWKGWDGKD